MQKTRVGQMDQQPQSYELMFWCYLDVGGVYNSEQTKPRELDHRETLYVPRADGALWPQVPLHVNADLDSYIKDGTHIMTDVSVCHAWENSWYASWNYCHLPVTMEENKHVLWPNVSWFHHSLGHKRRKCLRWEDFSSVSQLVLILRMRDHHLMTPPCMYTNQPKYIVEKLKSSRDCI